MPLNRTKLKYGTMMLKAYEKIIWMIELGAMHLLGPKEGSLLVHPESASECTLGCTSCGVIYEGLLSKKSYSRN